MRPLRPLAHEPDHINGYADRPSSELPPTNATSAEWPAKSKLRRGLTESATPPPTVTVRYARPKTHGSHEETQTTSLSPMLLLVEREPPNHRRTERPVDDSLTRR